MRRPLVSVLVPAYNHARYVATCLDSLAAQTWPRIEVVILDDGSTDGTRERIREALRRVESRFERVLFVEKHNEGVCRTLNRGVDLSRGEYVEILASDDVLLPRAVETLVGFLESEPRYDAVYADGHHVLDGQLQPGADPLVGAVRIGHALPPDTTDLTPLVPRHVYDMAIVGAMFRRSCVASVGPFDESLPCEDLDYALRLTRAHRVAWLPVPVVYHRVHAANVGWSPQFLERCVSAVIAKLERHPLATREAQEQALLTLRKSAADFDGQLAAMRGRRLVGWGTGSLYRRAAARYGFELSYLVDASLNRQGEEVDGLAVRDPDVIRAEEPGAVFVLVLSQYYAEIHARLESWGLVRGADFY